MPIPTEMRAIEIKPDLPPAMLGRQAPSKKGFFRTLAQLWSERRPPESFRPRQLRQDAGVGARQYGNQEVRVFLQDMPRVLSRHRTGELAAGDFFGAALQ